jgi:hypothetical protein
MIRHFWTLFGREFARILCQAETSRLPQKEEGIKGFFYFILFFSNSSSKSTGEDRQH